MWPHGEWSLGYGSERPDGGEWDDDPFVGMGVVDTEEARSRASAALAALNLSDAPNSTKAAPRGLKGMSGYGQQMVKAAGHLMQEKWPRHRKTLGTITLPPMSPEARAEVVAAWPDLTRELLRWLTRKLQRQGLPQVIVSVTEIQPRRLAGSGGAYLHWHLLWLNAPGRKGNWAVSPCEVRAWLEGLLRRHSSSYTGGHVNVNTKPVEGTVAAYLAKYMSKGKQAVAEAVKDWGEGNCPRTWWNMTKPARDMVKAATFKGRQAGQLLESMLGYAWNTNPEELYAFIRHIDLTYDGVTYTAGWRGRFHSEVSLDVRVMLESVHMDRLAK